MKAEIGIYPKDRQLLRQILPIDTPLIINLFVSNVCNFKCNYCIQSEPIEVFHRTGLKREFMDYSTFELAVSQMKAFPQKIKQLVFVGMGEPLLHKDLPRMIRDTRAANVADTTMVITNASTLTRELSNELVSSGLQILRVSLQGLTSSKYRTISQVNIDWEEFYDNIVYFSKIKGDCKLKVKIADTALASGDEKRFYEMFGDICDAIAIEHIFDAFSPAGMTYEIPFAATNKSRYGHERRRVEVCWLPFIRMDVHPDGSVAPCCNAAFKFPQKIKDSPLIEQWNSVEISQMREDFLKHDLRNYSSCQICHVPTENYHPEDILDGFEQEILERMRDKGLIS